MSNELKLNIKAMDTIHDEFENILQELKETQDNAKFMQLFKQMIEHTKMHFKFEEEIMEEHNFYDKKEHFDEHENLLAEMQFFYDKSKKIHPFGRSYINEYAYEKFKRHILNIDSQLAMFLKANNLQDIE